MTDLNLYCCLIIAALAAFTLGIYALVAILMNPEWIGMIIAIVLCVWVLRIVF